MDTNRVARTNGHGDFNNDDIKPGVYQLHSTYIDIDELLRGISKKKLLYNCRVQCHPWITHKSDNMSRMM